MPDNQQINEQDLEKQTNAEAGWEPSAEVGQSLGGSATGEPATQDAKGVKDDVTEAAPVADKATEAPPDATPEAKPEEKIDYAARAKELEEQFKALTETPYKSVAEIVKGYKEIQGQYTKVNEKVKPVQQLLDQMAKDPTLRTFMEQAAQAYYNPAMLEAYNQTGIPDRKSYDMYSEEGAAKYDADIKAYYERTIDQRIGARLGQVEQQNALERAKMDFKSKFPDKDPERVLEYAKGRSNDWSLADVMKIMEYDNLKSQALEDARKEVTKQLETAQKSGSPVAASAPKVSVKVDDILGHISKYGSDSAMKKFTKAKVEEALMESL